MVSDISEMLYKYLKEDSKVDKSQFESKFDEYKNNDPEFFLELIELSITNISKLRKILKSYIQDENLNKVKQIGNSLKGIALSLDLSNLIDLSAELERLKEFPSVGEHDIFNKVDREIQIILDNLDLEIARSKKK